MWGELRRSWVAYVIAKSQNDYEKIKGLKNYYKLKLMNRKMKSQSAMSISSLCSSLGIISLELFQ
jgi:hypothetical protein